MFNVSQMKTLYIYIYVYIPTEVLIRKNKDNTRHGLKDFFFNRQISIGYGLQFFLFAFIFFFCDRYLFPPYCTRWTTTWYSNLSSRFFSIFLGYTYFFFFLTNEKYYSDLIKKFKKIRTTHGIYFSVFLHLHHPVDVDVVFLARTKIIRSFFSK